MTVVAPVVDLLLANSQASSILVLGAYLAYEIRFGKLNEVQRTQQAFGVALYRVIERIDGLDEDAFREEVWGEEDSDLLLTDLDAPEQAEG